MQIKEIISRIRALYNKGAATDDTRLSDRLIYAKLKSTNAWKELENEVESSKSEDQAQSLANIEKELNNIITKEE